MGTVWGEALAAGSLEKHGRSWFWRWPGARCSGGLFRVKVTPRDNPSGYRIDIKGFGDMSSATDPVMTINTTMCGQTSSTTNTWLDRENTSGWLVNLDPVAECGGPTPTPVVTPTPVPT